MPFDCSYHIFNFLHKVLKYFRHWLYIEMEEIWISFSMSFEYKEENVKEYLIKIQKTKIQDKALRKLNIGKPHGHMVG